MINSNTNNDRERCIHIFGLRSQRPSRQVGGLPTLENLVGSSRLITNGCAAEPRPLVWGPANGVIPYQLLGICLEGFYFPPQGFQNLFSRFPQFACGGFRGFPGFHTVSQGFSIGFSTVFTVWRGFHCFRVHSFHSFQNFHCFHGLVARCATKCQVLDAVSAHSGVRPAHGLGSKKRRRQVAAACTRQARKHTHTHTHPNQKQ